MNFFTAYNSREKFRNNDGVECIVEEAQSRKRNWKNKMFTCTGTVTIETFKRRPLVGARDSILDDKPDIGIDNFGNES